MKRCRALGLGLALWAGTVAGATVDIKLYDAFGQSYRSVNIGERLGAIYNIPFDPTMVLVLGPSLDDPRVRDQERILGTLDPDEHGILFALGSPSQTYDRGFSMAPNTVAELLPADDAFRVIVLGSDGRILFESTTVLPRERLIEISPAGG